MDTMKKFLIYALMVVGLFIFSEFLINVGLNSTYKEIKREGNNSQIVVYQADATYVNGRIRGIIKNTEAIQNKYLKIEIYSKRDKLLGRSYIEIKDTEKESTQPFELLFRVKDAEYYKIEIVNEKEDGNELKILPKEWTKSEILLATAVTFLIFWG